MKRLTLMSKRLSYNHDNFPIIPADLGTLPGMTTITGQYPKPWMMPWIKKESKLEVKRLLDRIYKDNLDIPTICGSLDAIVNAAEVKRDTRADEGTQAHDLIQAILANKPVPFDVLKGKPKHVRKSVDDFYKWRDHVGFRMIDSEQVVYCRCHRVAGRLDTVGYVFGEVALVDWKTGKGVYVEGAIQGAGYAHCYGCSMPKLIGAKGIEITKLIILHLGQEQAAFQPYDYTKYQKELFAEFEHLKATWEFDKRQREWQTKVDGSSYGSRLSTIPA